MISFIYSYWDSRLFTGRIARRKQEKIYYNESKEESAYMKKWKKIIYKIVPVTSIETK